MLSVIDNERKKLLTTNAKKYIIVLYFLRMG